jgi:CSLREA domain-containing protein
MAVKVVTVDSTADEVDDDVGDSICHTASGHCTLRAAVMQAVNNNNPTVTDAIKIIVPAGTYTFTIPVAEGGGALNVADTLNGDPIIEIDGAGAALTIVDANHIDRAFFIQQRRVILSGMTLRNGSTVGSGGGIYSLGNLTINAVPILSNDAGTTGGGIYQTQFASSGLNIHARCRRRIIP